MVPAETTTGPRSFGGHGRRTRQEDSAPAATALSGGGTFRHATSASASMAFPHVGTMAGKVAPAARRCSLPAWSRWSSGCARPVRQPEAANQHGRGLVRVAAVTHARPEMVRQREGDWPREASGACRGNSRPDTRRMPGSGRGKERGLRERRLSGRAGCRAADCGSRPRRTRVEVPVERARPRVRHCPGRLNCPEHPLGRPESPFVAARKLSIRPAHDMDEGGRSSGLRGSPGGATWVSRALLQGPPRTSVRVRRGRVGPAGADLDAGCHRQDFWGGVACAA